MTPHDQQGAAAVPTTGRAARWLARELALLSGARPRTHRLLLRVWRNPVAVLVPVAAVALGIVGAASPDGDAEWFRRAGLGMLGPGLWGVFADAGLQIGVLVLLPVALLVVIADALGISAPFLVSAAQGAFVTWVALVAGRRATDVTGAPVLPAQWAVGGSLALGGVLAEATAIGHPEEVLIGLLLVLAACSAAEGHGRRVGGLLGVAVGLKLWGALGAPVALIGRSPRVVAVAGVVAGVVAAACYAPFLLWGEVNTFDFAWTSNRFGLRELVGPGPSDWVVRVGQGAASVLVGCCVALRRAGSPTTVVVCIIATRLLLDSVVTPHYLGPLVVTGMLWAWASRDRATRRAALAVTLLVPAFVVLPYVVGKQATYLGYVVLMVLVPAAALLGDRRAAGAAERGARPPDDPPTGPWEHRQSLVRSTTSL